MGLVKTLTSMLSGWERCIWVQFEAFLEGIWCELVSMATCGIPPLFEGSTHLSFRRMVSLLQTFLLMMMTMMIRLMILVPQVIDLRKRLRLLWFYLVRV